MRGCEGVPFDAGMLAMGFVLYAANNALLKPLGLPGVIGVFVSGHLNDVVAGLAFMAYTNLLFDIVRPSRRLTRLWAVVPYIVCCGVFWECVAPALLKPSVTDPWDIVSYAAGGSLYWCVDAIRRRAATLRSVRGTMP